MCDVVRERQPRALLLRAGDEDRLALHLLDAGVVVGVCVAGAAVWVDRVGGRARAGARQSRVGLPLELLLTEEPVLAGLPVGQTVVERVLPDVVALLDVAAQVRRVLGQQRLEVALHRLPAELHSLSHRSDCGAVGGGDRTVCLHWCRRDRLRRSSRAEWVQCLTDEVGAGAV